MTSPQQTNNEPMPEKISQRLLAAAERMRKLQLEMSECAGEIEQCYLLAERFSQPQTKTQKES